MGSSRSSSRPVRGVDDIAPQTIDRYHLIDDSFPGIDESGKINLDQNSGTAVPLSQIPDSLIGKDADSVDGYHAADLIRPISMTFLADGDVVVWNSQPIALTEFLGVIRHRMKFDLTKFTQARLVVNVATAGSTNAKLRAQYSIGFGWFYLDGLAGPSVAINATGLFVSSWVNLTSEAKADVDIRIIGINGNGLTSPGFGSIALQFK